MLVPMRSWRACLAVCFAATLWLAAAASATAADPVAETIKEARRLNRTGENQAAVKLLEEAIA